ncbi:MAG: hypothetical protein JW737_03700 [Acidobacteria bacterium]|nr:hypothetical protein [Acidobacteriota bacterium]
MDTLQKQNLKRTSNNIWPSEFQLKAIVNISNILIWIGWLTILISSFRIIVIFLQQQDLYKLAFEIIFIVVICLVSLLLINAGKSGRKVIDDSRESSENMDIFLDRLLFFLRIYITCMVIGICIIIIGSLVILSPACNFHQNGF